MTTSSADPVARLAPELRDFAAARTNLSSDVLGAVRAGLDQRRRETATALDVGGLEVSDVTVDGVSVRMYRGAEPVVLYCHSGAFVLGNLDTDHRQCVELARRTGFTVASVAYRLAPEHPYPAALDDVFGVLRWLTDQGASRIAVAGNSAGGALAAAVAQRAPVAFQLLHQPVLDDRTTPSKAEFTATPGFDGPASVQMWQHYSGGIALPDDAVPARAVNLAGLPPALITCSELDPLRDEAIDYATRLLRAGVATELHVIPGTCHGYDSLLPDWEVSQQTFALQAAALRRALKS